MHPPLNVLQEGMVVWLDMQWILIRE